MRIQTLSISPSSKVPEIAPDLIGNSFAVQTSKSKISIPAEYAKSHVVFVSVPMLCFLIRSLTFLENKSGKHIFTNLVFSLYLIHSYKSINHPYIFPKFVYRWLTHYLSFSYTKCAKWSEWMIIFLSLEDSLMEDITSLILLLILYSNYSQVSVLFLSRDVNHRCLKTS